MTQRKNVFSIVLVGIALLGISPSESVAGVLDSFIIDPESSYFFKESWAYLGDGTEIDPEEKYPISGTFDLVSDDSFPGVEVIRFDNVDILTPVIPDGPFQFPDFLMTFDGANFSGNYDPCNIHDLLRIGGTCWSFGNFGYYLGTIIEADLDMVGAAPIDYEYSYHFRISARSAFAPTDVLIEIKPARGNKVMNPFGKGMIGVALLGSDTFDVDQVDVTTLSFGPGGAQPVFDLTRPFFYFLSRLRDVNEDGNGDLTSHYRIRETGIATGDTEACLTGETIDGTPFKGCDGIETVSGCGSGYEAGFLLLPLVWLDRKRKRLSA